MARTIVGTVVSDKADKTIVLSETVRKTHPIYKKQYSRSTKYIAHDENNEAKVGDKVEVEETRPISRRKHLRLVRVISHSAIAEKDKVENVTKESEVQEVSKDKPEKAVKKKSATTNTEETK